MNHQHDELEEKLWELEYGLLTDDEAEALRQRLASDPELSSAHAQVKRRLALVARAAKVEVPRISLRRSAPDSSLNVRSEISNRPDGSSVPIRVGEVKASSRATVRRGMSWLIATAALLLLGLFSASQFLPRAGMHTEVAVAPPENFDQAPAAPPAVGVGVQDSFAGTSPESGAVPRAEERFVKIQVAAPPQLQPNISNNFFFETASVDGQPQSTDLAVSFHDAKGEVRLQTVVPTDSKGQAMLALPPTISNEVVRMQVAARATEPPIEASLRPGPESYVTHLVLDRPRYQVGDVVRFRSVTLSRFSLKADREHKVEYALSDPSGAILGDATQIGTTDRGVGNGEFVLDENVQGGQYTVIARSVDDSFGEVQRDFYVLTDQTRQWDVRVAWSDEDGLVAGKSASATVEVRDLEGKPADNLPVRGEAFIDGHPVEIPQSVSRTNANGQATFEFTLPETISFGEGNLYVAVGSDESIEERIPIKKTKVLMDVFPEGGDLIAGVPSRVYFAANDGAGSPVAVNGRVLDSQSREVAEFTSQYEGRGAFRFTPLQNERYTLQITEPEQATTDAALPVAVRQEGVVIDAGEGVVTANQPLTFLLRSGGSVRPLRVAVNCRGAFVGHLTVQPNEFRDGECEVTVPLAETAGGVLRVTIFENDEPVAERLVYREPNRKLVVEVDGVQDRYAAGSKVQLAFTCRDETGAASPGVLGVSVVDENVLRLARSKPANLATQFWFATDIESPEELEDVNFYLNGTPESKTALDLLLGTQGWRRFERLPVTRMAKAGMDAAGGYALGLNAPKGPDPAATQADAVGPMAELYGHGASISAVTDLPMYLDNSSVLEEEARDRIAQMSQPAAPSNTSEAFDGSKQARGAEAAAPDGPVRSVADQARPAFREISVLALAVIVLCFSAICLIFGIASNRWVAGFGVLSSAMVLLIGLLTAPERSVATDANTYAWRSPAPNPSSGESMTASSSTEQKSLGDETTLGDETMPNAKREAVRFQQVEPLSQATAAAEGMDARAELKDGRDTRGVEAKAMKAADPQTPDADFAKGPLQPDPDRVSAVPAQRSRAAAPEAARAERFNGDDKIAPTPPPPAPPAPAPSEPLEAAKAKQIVPPPPAPTAVAEQPAPPNDPAEPEASIPADENLSKKLAEGRMNTRMARARTFLRDMTELEGTTSNEGLRGGSKSLEALELLQRKDSNRQSGVTLSAPDSIQQQPGLGGGAARASGRPNVRADEFERSPFIVRQYAHQRIAAKDRQANQLDHTETIYWNPMLVVDADGRAEVAFDTSDAATTFQLRIDAHQDGRLGSQTAEIKTQAGEEAPSKD